MKPKANAFSEGCVAAVAPLRPGEPPLGALEPGQDRLDQIGKKLEGLQRRLAVCEAENDEFRVRTAQYEERLQMILQSRAWRVYHALQPCWGGVRRILTTGRTGSIFRPLYCQFRHSLRAFGYARRKARGVLWRLPGVAFLDRLRQRAASQRLFQAAIRRTFSTPTADGQVVFPQSPSPLVSIVIPVHNQWQHTLWCLRSIAANSGDVPYEVIVADDASTDDTCRIGAHFQNVRVVQTDADGPYGFLKNCNSAAKQARGKHLLLLNNDTLVQEGWLQALVDVVEGDDRAGLVGCKLLYPNKRLQEAGGIIWQDGSGNNYGRGELPDGPEYNYLRETDYVSGAAILVRRSLWEEIGGFDERFAPAYYEDTDLAFEVRRRGYRVLYQPAAKVIHIEGVSHGTDLGQGIKRHQVVNRRRFVEKWHSVLEKEHFAPCKDFFLARDHSRCRKHVLVFDWTLPTPDRDSGSLRMANLLQILGSLDCRVTLFPVNDHLLQPYLGQLQQQGVFVPCGPGSMPMGLFLKEYGRYFDLVIVSRVNVGTVCMDLVKRYCPHALVVFDTVDLHFLREQRRAELENSDAARAVARATKQNELRLMRQADLTLVVSPVEVDLLRREAPETEVRILSNIHLLHDRGNSFADRKDLLFIGHFRHSPNVDAVQWFVGEVFPKIRQRLTGVQLYVIGSHPPDELRTVAEAAEGVRLLGFVEDVEPCLRSCRLSVVPLRYGAGVKGKINTSMSYGLPVVSTTIGCEGMFLQDGVDVLVADDADAFADAVCRSYEDEQLWEQLSRAGRENVEQHFSFEVAAATVRQIVERADGCAAARGETPRPIVPGEAERSGREACGDRTRAA